MTRLGYADESQRGERYLVAAMAVDPAAVRDVRRQLGRLAPKGGVARRHFVKESDSERRKLLDAFRSLPGIDVVVVDHQGAGSIVAKREQCLGALVGELRRGGLAQLVLDNVDEAQRRRDRRALARYLTGSATSYRHEAAHSREPMLWVPDAVAWCAGARRDWRSEIDGWVRTLRVS